MINEYNADLDRIRARDPSSALLSPASVAKGLAAIEEKFKETTKKVSDDSAKVYMMQLAQQEATLREQLGSNQKLGEAQKQLIKFEQQLSDRCSTPRLMHHKNLPVSQVVYHFVYTIHDIR